MNTSEFMFSASSLKEYMQCGLKFKYKRIDRLEPTAVASHHRWFGTLVHNMIYTGIAHYDGNKDLELREKPNEKGALKLLNDIWDYDYENEFETAHLKSDDISKIVTDIGVKPSGRFMVGKIKSLGNDNPSITQKELEKGWKIEARKMVKNGISVAGNIYEIVELEKKLIWNFLDHRFIGYADVVGKNSEGKYEFYDFKTAWNKPGKYLANDFQFFAYSYALRQLYGLEYYPTGHYVHLRSGEVIPNVITEEITQNMVSKAKSAFSNMEADVFFDAYGSPLCRYCDFRHICYGEDEDIWQ